MVSAAPVVVEELRVSGLRILRDFRIEPRASVNVLIGPNGAGKTSVLEALSLLGFGRSFRSGGFAALIDREGRTLEVFARVRCGERAVRLGMGRSRGDTSWSLRVDAEPAKGLAAVARYMPMAVFEPDCHELIQGGPDGRRRLADWAMFHVEPALVSDWRRYHRALRQRNELLRNGGRPSEFRSWEQVLSQSGERLAAWRESHVATFGEKLSRLLPLLSEALSGTQLSYRPGWEGESLADAIEQSRDEDRRVGYGRVGPHRFDYQLADRHGLLAKRLSRGQQKIAALAFTLAQAQLLTEATHVAPVICLDDLGSELDEKHQRLALGVVEDLGAQTWITGVSPLVGIPEEAVFHVEPTAG